MKCLRKRFKIPNQNCGLYLAEFCTYNHTHPDVSQNLQPLWFRSHTSVNIYLKEYFVLYLTQQPPMDHGLLIHEVSRSHNDAPQSVGHLWASDQLVAETSTCTTHKTQSRHPYPCGIRTHNLSRQAAIDLRLRPPGTGTKNIGTVQYNNRFYCRDSMRFLLSYWDSEWWSGHMKGCTRLAYRKPLRE